MVTFFTEKKQTRKGEGVDVLVCLTTGYFGILSAQELALQWGRTILLDCSNGVGLLKPLQPACQLIVKGYVGTFLPFDPVSRALNLVVVSISKSVYDTTPFSAFCITPPFNSNF